MCHICALKEPKLVEDNTVMAASERERGREGERGSVTRPAAARSAHSEGRVCVCVSVCVCVCRP